jgi:hypothetical protein
MFDLPKQKAKLASVNLRAELHGEDKKPAVDLKIEAACANDTLIHFHPELRQMLFKKVEQNEADLVDQADPEALTALRFAKMGALKWDQEYVGYTATIDYGLGGASDIALEDCSVDGFRFEPQQGGSVLITFRIICHPSSDDIGRLSQLIQRDIELTVTPPEPTTVQELFGDQKAA